MQKITASIRLITTFRSENKKPLIISSISLRINPKNMYTQGVDGNIYPTSHVHLP